MRSFPWDSLVVSMGDDGFPIYDRDYMASDLREVYETFFSNGVFLDAEDALQVTAGEGMTVHVAPGKCCIRGTVGYEKSIRELALQASSSQDRIDTVVLRWNANVEMRNIDLYVKSGVAAATPVAPTLTRSETVYELGLADIFVTKNSGAISAARITDTRMNTDRCGVVTPLVNIDMTSFYETMQSALAELEAKLDEQTQIAVGLAQSALDETTAGYLQSQITANKQAIEDNSASDEEFRGSIYKIRQIVEYSFNHGVANSGSFNQFQHDLTPYDFKNTPVVLGAYGTGGQDCYVVIGAVTKTYMFYNVRAGNYCIQAGRIILAEPM